MKMRKKTIAVLLAFAVALALAPVVPAKADGPVTVTLHYNSSTIDHDTLASSISNGISSFSTTGYTIGDNINLSTENNTISFTVTPPTSGGSYPSVSTIRTDLNTIVKQTLNNLPSGSNIEDGIDAGELFSLVALHGYSEYQGKNNVLEVNASDQSEEDNQVMDSSRDFYILWASNEISSVSLTVNPPTEGEEIGGSLDSADRKVPSIAMGADTYSITPPDGSRTLPSAYWCENNLSPLSTIINADVTTQYGVQMYLIPKLNHYFSTSAAVTISNADIYSSTIGWNASGYSSLEVKMNNITPVVPSPPVSAPVTPSYTAPTTVSEPDPAPASTPMPKTVIDVVDPPSLYGTFPYGTDVRSKLPTEVTLSLADGSTDVAQISWLQKSVSRIKEIFSGSVTLPPGVADPFDIIAPSFDYEATITHKDIISIDNDGRPLTAVADFSEKDKVDDIYLPKTLTAHITDGTTYDIVPSWTLISQTETELKYETAINSAALLVDGIENPRQIGKVEFTITLMDKPKGKFDLREYDGKFTVPYSNNTIHRVELKTNDKGEITFSSDDKEVVTVKNKAGYGYDDNCIITLIKPGTTTVRAYIDGIEVDSMEVVVNKLDHDLKVTYKGKSSVTFKAADLKKENKIITLTIKGNKTKITATKSSTSLYFIPSTKKLTLYKGIKKETTNLK